MKRRTLTAQQQRERIAKLAVMRDIRINKTINTSIPAILKRIIHTKKRCEDCPRTVKNRVIESHVVFYPVRHWLQRCNKCDAFLCHRTGRYQLSWQTAHSQTLTDIGYHRMVSKLNKKNLTPEQQRDLQKYRNQLQSLRVKDKNVHKITTDKDSE